MIIFGRSVARSLGRSLGRSTARSVARSVARSRRADSNGCGITSGDGLEPQLQAFQVGESGRAGPVSVFIPSRVMSISFQKIPGPNVFKTAGL